MTYSSLASIVCVCLSKFVQQNGKFNIVGNSKLYRGKSLKAIESYLFKSIKRPLLDTIQGEPLVSPQNRTCFEQENLQAEWAVYSMCENNSDK